MRSIVFVVGVLLLGSELKAQDLNLTEQERAAFAQQALEKARELSMYIDKLCNKSTPSSIQVEAMDLALDLFRDHERIVEVSKKNSDDLLYPTIDRYLNRLVNYNYTKVEVTWYDVSYASDLKPGTDGRYYGTITVFQKFVGYVGDGIVAYEDVTQKNIEVILEPRIKRVGDQEFEALIVLLGDIQVMQTE